MEKNKIDILEGYLSKIDDIPTLPYVIVQIMEKIHQPDPRIKELADLVMTDQVLTTRMLKLVNSVFWGLNKELTSVKAAIIYLGLREISNLIYSVSLTNTFERDTPLMKRVLFWEHSFGCAICSKYVAQRIGYQDEDLAYVAGLLHDIGEVVIAIYFQDEFEQVVCHVLDHGMTFCEAEDDVLGINHTDFGSWLIDKWSVPVVLSDVVAYHHSIEKAEKNEALVGIVRLADLICQYHRLDFGYSDGVSLTSEIVSVWRFLSKHCPGITRIEMKPFLEEFNDQIGAVKEMVKKVYLRKEIVEA